MLRRNAWFCLLLAACDGSITGGTPADDGGPNSGHLPGDGDGDGDGNTTNADGSTGDGDGGDPGTGGDGDGDGSEGRSYPTSRAEFGLGGTSRCDSADVLLCEDFESGAIDSSTWTIESWGTGSATVESSRAARGSHSLHITEPSQSARVVLREVKTFATTGNHFFGRFFLYLDYTTDPLECHMVGDHYECPNLVHWTAAAAGGVYEESGNSYEPEVRAVGAVNQRLLVNLDGGPKAEVGLDDNDSAPEGYRLLDASHVGEWMCFEFEYVGEGESAELRVWWDGRLHPAMHYSTAQRGQTGELWAIPKYDHLDFGFAHYQDYSGFVSKFDAWLDEIAVDSERIGCAL